MNPTDCDSIRYRTTFYNQIVKITEILAGDPENSPQGVTEGPIKVAPLEIERERWLGAFL